MKSNFDANLKIIDISFVKHYIIFERNPFAAIFIFGAIPVFDNSKTVSKLLLFGAVPVCDTIFRSNSNVCQNNFELITFRSYSIMPLN